MSFFDSIYRLYGTEDIDPTAEGTEMPEVPIGMEEEPPQIQQPRPRMVPPRMARPGFDAYLEHIRNMPTEEDFAPSTGRRIGAGIVGFAAGLRDPSAGFNAAEQVLRSPYNRALSEWSTKGGQLGKLASEEGDYAGNAMDYAAEGGKLEARYAELEARKGQIEKNYAIASKNATTAEAKVQAQKDRDEAMQTILEERNKIDRFEAQSGRMNAQTNQERAGSYGRYVDAYESGAGKTIPPPSPDNMMKAEQDVLLELMASDPKFREFFNYDEDTGVTPIMEDWTPEQLAERQALMTKVGLETQKRIGGTAAGGAPPLWKMRPDVTIPPNRRRMR